MASNRYKVMGMFCGPSCAKAFAAHSYRCSDLDSVYRFIERVATDYYGYQLYVKIGQSKMCTIPEAPPKEILQKYCGPKGFTIEQYRNMCSCGRTLKIHPPHVITRKQIVEAEQQWASKKRVYHVENPDDVQCISELVTKKRIPFAGRGARRITDYLRTRT